MRKKLDDTLSGNKIKAIEALIEANGLSLYKQEIMSAIRKVPEAYASISYLLIRPHISDSELECFTKTLETISNTKEEILKIGYPNQEDMFSVATPLAFYLGGEEDRFKEILELIRKYNSETQFNIMKFAIKWPLSNGFNGSIIVKRESVYHEGLLRLVKEIVEKNKTDEDVRKDLLTRLIEMNYSAEGRLREVPLLRHLIGEAEGTK